MKRRTFLAGAAGAIAAPALLLPSKVPFAQGGGFSFGDETGFSGIRSPSAAGAAAAAAEVTITFTDSSVDESNLTAPYSYTFSTQAIGTASADRIVIVGVALTNFNVDAGSISGVTIAGETATQRQSVKVGPGTGNEILMEFWTAPVTSGNTGNVVVSFANANALQCGIAVWAMTGASSAVPTATANDTDSNTNSTSGFTLSAAITVAANGGFVAYAADVAAIWDDSYVWASATENVDEAIEPNASHSAAQGTASATVEVTGTKGGGSDADRGLIIAAWGP